MGQFWIVIFYWESLIKGQRCALPQNRVWSNKSYGQSPQKKTKQGHFTEVPPYPHWTTNCLVTFPTIWIFSASLGGVAHAQTGRDQTLSKQRQDQTETQWECLVLTFCDGPVEEESVYCGSSGGGGPDSRGNSLPARGMMFARHLGVVRKTNRPVSSAVITQVFSPGHVTQTLSATERPLPTHAHPEFFPLVLLFLIFKEFYMILCYLVRGGSYILEKALEEGVIHL